MTTLLRQAMLYDGTGEKPYIGDVLIQGERIARVAPSIDAEAERVIDLRGKSVAPGFIDVHSHNDWFAVRENNLPYFEPFIRQGITSFVTGNCGLSAIAFEKDTPHLDKIGGGLFGFAGMVVGVPVFAVLYALASSFFARRLREKGIDEEGNPLPPADAS